MRNRKRAGQRFYSDMNRALRLAAAGNSPADVARALGVNRSTVRTWLYRARLTVDPWTGEPIRRARVPR